MIQPPLQLERSFFTEVQVEADPRHKPEKAKVKVKAEHGLGVLTADASRWQVDLDLVVAPEAAAPPPPYRIHLHVIGFFTFVDTSRTEVEKARVLAVTGVSILYSQAREYLLMLTSRGPWGPFQLPTVSFADAQPESQGIPGASAVREPAAEYQTAKTSARKAARSSTTRRRRPARVEP